MPGVRNGFSKTLNPTRATLHQKYVVQPLQNGDAVLAYQVRTASPS